MGGRTVRELKLRQSQQDCSCRLCDRIIKRNDEELVFWSTSLGGKRVQIILCKECVKHLNKFIGVTNDQVERPKSQNYDDFEPMGKFSGDW